MVENDAISGKLGETLLVTCTEARDMLGGISSTTLNRWANKWGLRKVGHRFVRSDIVAAVSRVPQNGGESDGNDISAVNLHR